MGFITKINSLNDIEQFEIEKVPVYYGDNAVIPGVFSLRRADTRQHLGTVSDKYRPIQMDEMIDVLDKASNLVDADIEHVGYTTSRGGRKILIQSKVSESINVDGDEVVPYFYTVIDNTGMGSNKTIPSTIRISCDNAFHLIMSTSEDNSRHSTLFDAKVKDMTNRIVTSIDSAKNFNKTMELLKSQSFSRDKMFKLTEELFDVSEDESNQQLRKREKIVELFETGQGNVGETRWDAFNAVTEYETHTGRQSPEKLIRNLVNKTMSRKALTLLA